MANNVYPKFKEALLQASANSALTGVVKAALVDTAVYTYSAAHEFQTSLTGVVGTAQTLASKTYVNGVFDAADVVFTAVTGATVEALVLYIDTGTPATSRLVLYVDTASGLPATPNGGDITVTWNASGILSI